MKKNREDFMNEVKSAEESFSELCRRYGISRKTGYKWLERFRTGESMCDRSRAPFHTPNKTPEQTEQHILNIRNEHPAWGPRKLKRILENEGLVKPPAASTICEILNRNHRISKAESLAHTPFKRFVKENPNDLWQTDFKGDFSMQDGNRCYPLTVLDDHSRFSLCIDAKTNQQGVGVIMSFERLFDTYGLPLALLCDNGNPWGTSQSTGYTRFEIWLMDLGILPIHGRPMHPQTQGKEERFHRTMNEELLKRVIIQNLEDAQQKFEIFRSCYNYERPHNSLNNDSPSQHYRNSIRQMPKKIEEWEYPEGYELRKIKSSGYITYRNHGYFLSETFGNKVVGVRESSISGSINLYYREFLIGRINLDERVFSSKKIYRSND